jgi:hypothetical protein
LSGQSGNRPPFPPTPPDPVYIVLMNQTETNVFFRALHALEDSRATDLHPNMTAEELICQSPEYMEGYDYVMEDVKYAIMSGDVENMYALDEFVNHMDAFAEDNEPGDYANGYQDAVYVCLEAISVLLESEEA